MAQRITTILLVAALVCAAGPALAGSTTDQAVERATFYKDVLPIMQENCQVCHRPSGLNSGGMIAPMSFLSYQDVRPWAKAIARNVESGYMPPWGAAPEFHGVFQNERSLTEEQRETIIRWARSGAPAGDPADAPPPIEFPETDWAIGEPDLILQMPDTFLVGDDVEDLYENFAVDVPLDEDRWVKAIEFRPGSEVVHHIIGYAIAPGEDFGGGSRGQLGGIAPGNQPDEFPDGYGYLMKKDSKFIFAMHYHKESGPGTATPDRSTVGIKFYPKDAHPEQVYIDAIGNMQFEIPPGEPNWQVGSARVFDRPVLVHFLMPHMHLRGKAARYVATYPDGRQETLLYVPNYDFNWQLSYEFKEPRLLPAGTRIDVSLWYENTKERADKNNFNSERAVRWGGPTTDEMDLGWLAYSYVDEGGGAEATGAGGR